MRNERHDSPRHFDADPVLRFAAEAVVTRIGDATSKLSDETINAISEVPWREIRGMRNVVTHAYHRLSYERVCNTLSDDMPALVDAIARFRVSGC